MAYAMNAGAAVFRTHCAQCHGAGAAGVQAAGYPNLLDDDWLWGGTVEEIAYTVRHGIRNTADPDAHFSQMPAFAEILEPAQIDAVVQHVRAISGQEHDAGQAAEGAVLYVENCASCHGEAGLGDPALGAPNLADAIWLYGGDVAALTRSVAQARYGVMPNWGGRLSEDEIRAVALYVHGLGGGQ
jgi:cytochrome c oxidase cbb3-type subunit 3